MQLYLQTTPFTTAASALLTIMHKLNPAIELQRKEEFLIWQKTVLLPTRGSSVFALALYAQEKGFNPRVIIEDKEYRFPDYRFYRYTKEEIASAAFSEEIYLKNARKKNILIEERKITLNEIKDELAQQNIILLRLNTKPFRNAKRNTSNYVVVHDFQDKYFQIIDPALGGLSIPESTMQEAFETLEKKKYRDHRMIIFGQNSKKPHI